MRVFLRVRFIVVLSLIYLCLVLLLYHYLWRAGSLEHGLTFLELSNDNTDSISLDKEEYDVPRGDTVQFNFKRHNGLLQDTNTTTLNASTSRNSSYSNGSSSHRTPLNTSNLPSPSKCIHVFYYMWYGNPQHNGRYYHWNHRYLPDWRGPQKPLGRHTPPDDIGASFYPELGCYSSSDPAVIEAHMHQLRRAGIGVVAASWYPKGLADDEGYPPDPLIPLLLEIAQIYSIKVTLHIEPYRGRTADSVVRDLQYIMENYSTHPAFYKHKRHSTADGSTKLLPLIYVYDSYLIEAQQWARVLKPGGHTSIRGTPADAIVIGLLVESSHQDGIVRGGFDGFYTYFASDGFCYGSTTRHWSNLAKFARTNNLMFIPSFGPGYDDVRVRPWNQQNTKARNGGAYYRNMFRAAIQTSVNLDGRHGVVSLTSFNEWHEGTQIETAIAKGTDYKDYSPGAPDLYLQITREVSLDHMQCQL